MASMRAFEMETWEVIGMFYVDANFKSVALEAASIFRKVVFPGESPGEFDGKGATKAIQ